MKIAEYPDERWLPIAEYEHLYETSSFGRVRSLPRTTTAGCILKPWLSSGYPTVALSKDGIEVHYRVALLVLETFVGPRPEGQLIRHYPDPDKSNCALSNLSWATASINVYDQVEHGVHPQAKKTACARKNHPFTPENTYIDPAGSRRCKTCRREDQEQRRNKRVMTV